MPQPLTKQEVDSKTDPSVAKQWDTETSMDKQWEEFYAVCDSNKIAMMGTNRPGIGPVHRSMAVAKRTGPDFLFLANNHSQKFKDLENEKTITLTFHNSTNQDWVSITGHAATTSNDDPRIEKVWSKGASIWFGDLGDGVHDASPKDPRMTLIEVRATYISYWKSKTGLLGMVKEMGGAAITGDVPVTGLLRQFKESDISQARSKDSELSK